MPKFVLATAPVALGSGYPAPYAAAFLKRRRIRLGDAAGLTRFGVNLTTLPPGGMSSLRHWHEVEEEMVVVLEGRLTLIEDGGEAELGPGEAAGFPANSGNGHHFLNRTDTPARFLVVGSKAPRETATYSDVDLILHQDRGKPRFTYRDGTPWTGPK